MRGWQRMSKKKEPQRMNHEKHEKKSKGLVPGLRFPEFRDAGAWEAEVLSKIYVFKVTNSYSRDMLNYEKGLVKNIHYGDIHTKFSTLFDIQNEKVPFINPSESIEMIKEDCYCIEGDMVFADASEDLADVGKSIEIVNLNNERLLSGMHTLLARQKENKLVLSFGGHLFKSSRIRKQIQKESQGAKVLGISAGRLSGIEVCYPSYKNEQQKIADCLSSLDELITAEAQKLDMFKVHKKGLMQQLFPAEGETVPRLRFPEFRAAREWKEYQFGKLIKVNSGKGFKAAEYSKHGIRLVQIENIGYGLIKWNDNTIYLPQDYSIEFPELVLRQGDIVLALNRPVTNNELKIAQLKKKDEPSLLYQRVGKLELLSVSLADDFAFHLCQLFIKKFVVEQSIGSDQPFISVLSLYAQVILIPSPKEQQRIADCLTSLDELITAQAQKIDTLKDHKKGLMQGLFPSADEVGV